MSREIQSSTVGVNELATLLLPICSKLLVLPNVTVAEVIPYVNPIGEDDVPTWYLGKFTWRGVDVPLVSFEAINDEPFSSSSRDRRIAVINGLLDDPKLPFNGILVDGMPRLMRVMANEVAVDDEIDKGPAEISRVLVSGERAAIPDIDYIQREIIKLL